MKIEELEVLYLIGEPYTAYGISIPLTSSRNVEFEND